MIVVLLILMVKDYKAKRVQAFAKALATELGKELAPTSVFSFQFVFKKLNRVSQVQNEVEDQPEDSNVGTSLRNPGPVTQK